MLIDSTKVYILHHFCQENFLDEPIWYTETHTQLRLKNEKKWKIYLDKSRSYSVICY